MTDVTDVEKTPVSKDWRETVRDGLEESGFARESSAYNWDVLWPRAYWSGGDDSARDNVLYHFVGGVMAAVEQADDNVNVWEVLGYVYEFLVGPEGSAPKVLEHLHQHGWGCPLPVNLTDPARFSDMTDSAQRVILGTQINKSKSCALRFEGTAAKDWIVHQALIDDGMVEIFIGKEPNGRPVPRLRLTPNGRKMYEDATLTAETP